MATICILNLAKVHTWSPDPLENARACLAAGTMEHRAGRCLRTVHESKEEALPVSPSRRQRSPFSAHKEVRVVFWCMLIPIVLAAVWGAIIMRVSYYGHVWSFFPTIQIDGEPDSSLETPSISVPLPLLDLRNFCFAFQIVGAIQAFMTLSLHCAELVVNLIREEKSWRAASKQGRKCSNALSSLLRSFPALILFILKPVLHWMYSLACTVEFSSGISMRAPQIFYLGAGALVMAVFVALCTCWRPKGPQPAAYGHLQTLADLVDTWPNAGERMFWDEKDVRRTCGSAPVYSSMDDSEPSEAPGENNELMAKSYVRHAGTAAEKLQSVKFERKYM